MFTRFYPWLLLCVLGAGVFLSELISPSIGWEKSLAGSALNEEDEFSDRHPSSAWLVAPSMCRASVSFFLRHRRWVEIDKDLRLMQAMASEGKFVGFEILSREKLGLPFQLGPKKILARRRILKQLKEFRSSGLMTAEQAQKFVSDMMMLSRASKLPLTDPEKSKNIDRYLKEVFSEQIARRGIFQSLSDLGIMQADGSRITKLRKVLHKYGPVYNAVLNVWLWSTGTPALYLPKKSKLPKEVLSQAETDQIFENGIDAMLPHLREKYGEIAVSDLRRENLRKVLGYLSAVSIGVVAYQEYKEAQEEAAQEFVDQVVESDPVGQREVDEQTQLYIDRFKERFGREPTPKELEDARVIISATRGL